jgi:hypothetical protein
MSGGVLCWPTLSQSCERMGHSISWLGWGNSGSFAALRMTTTDARATAMAGSGWVEGLFALFPELFVAVVAELDGAYFALGVAFEGEAGG